MNIKYRVALGYVILGLVMIMPAFAHVQKPSVGVDGRGTAFAAMWNPDGTQLAIGGSHGIWLYTPNLKPITHFSGNDLEITALAWNPNGRQIASISHAAEVQLWDTTTGKAQTLQTTTPDLHEPGSLSYSPDGSRLASANAKTDVHIWDTTTGKLIQTLNTPGPVFTVSWEPNGTRIAIGGAKTDGTDPAGSLQIWNTPTSKVTKVFSNTDFLSLSSGNDSTVVQMLQWVDKRLVIVFAADYPIAVQGGIVAWNIQADQPSMPQPFVYLSCSDTATGISYSLDGSIYAYEKMISCPGTPELASITINTDKVEAFINYQLGEMPVRALAWRSDNRTIAVINGQGNIFVYDVLSGTATDPELKPKTMLADFR